jgi:hypothetical protein
MLTFSTEIVDLVNKDHWFVKATVYKGDRAIATAHVMPWGTYMPEMLREAEDKAVKEAFRLAQEHVLSQAEADLEK